MSYVEQQQHQHYPSSSFDHAYPWTDPSNRLLDDIDAKLASIKSFTHTRVDFNPMHQSFRQQQSTTVAATSYAATTALEDRYSGEKSSSFERGLPTFKAHNKDQFHRLVLGESYENTLQSSMKKQQQHSFLQDSFQPSRVQKYLDNGSICNSIVEPTTNRDSARSRRSASRQIEDMYFTPSFVSFNYSKSMMLDQSSQLHSQPPRTLTGGQPVHNKQASVRQLKNKFELDQELQQFSNRLDHICNTSESVETPNAIHHHSKRENQKKKSHKNRSVSQSMPTELSPEKLESLSEQLKAVADALHSLHSESDYQQSAKKSSKLSFKGLQSPAKNTAKRNESQENYKSSSSSNYTGKGAKQFYQQQQQHLQQSQQSNKVKRNTSITTTMKTESGSKDNVIMRCQSLIHSIQRENKIALKEQDAKIHSLARQLFDISGGSGSGGGDVAQQGKTFSKNNSRSQLNKSVCSSIDTLPKCRAVNLYDNLAQNTLRESGKGYRQEEGKSRANKNNNNVSMICDENPKQNAKPPKNQSKKLHVVVSKERTQMKQPSQQLQDVNARKLGEESNQRRRPRSSQSTYAINPVKEETYCIRDQMVSRQVSCNERNEVARNDSKRRR